jgi:sarcosine oxidase
MTSSSLEPEGAGRVPVRLGSGDLMVRHVISAVGAWTGDLLRAFGLPLQVRREVLGWFPARFPRDYTPDVFPVFIREDTQAHWLGFPTLDGQSIKLGIHEAGPQPHPARSCS